MNRTFSALLAAVAFLAAACGGGGGGDDGARPVEARYQAPGPAEVVQTSAVTANGMTVVLYHPSTINTDGYANPVIAYGNGSFAVCTEGQSKAFSRHLASWGFVVVCPESPSTAFGTQILQAVKFMVAENSRAGSAFEGQLDTVAIGTTGHSQGATGALNANTLSGGLVKATMTLAFVDPVLHDNDQPRLGDVKGPVFLASGCDDPLTTNQDNYFDQFATPVVKACRVGAAHGPMVEASRGYAVAWFMYTLRGDAQARGAFVASNGRPEISLNPLWQGWRSKQLP